jgi:DNA-binding MarR family transcriptional regulator
MGDIRHTKTSDAADSVGSDGGEISAERREVTGDIFTLLLEIGEALKERFQQAAESRGLGVAHVALLHTLRAPCRMGELAKELGYDASHITAVVDRLEERGLVVRSFDPSDRRVRLIERTPEGTTVAAEIERGLVDADEVFVRLPIADCRKIRELLQKGIDRYHASLVEDTGTDG